MNLAEELSDETVADIRAALLANRVVFFRDQSLDYESQVAFAQRLGTLTLGHPTIQSPPDQPLMEEVDSAKGAPAADWHTDVTFLDQPVSFTCLRSVVLPEVGGDTMWANTVNAYAMLSPELRALADSLRVIHTNAPKRRAHRRRPLEPGVARERHAVHLDDLPRGASRRHGASRDR